MNVAVAAQYFSSLCGASGAQGRHLLVDLWKFKELPQATLDCFYLSEVKTHLNNQWT